MNEKVYLCVNSNNQNIKSEFQCKMFKDFLDADNYFYENPLFLSKKSERIQSTIIDVPFYIPTIFHEKYLKYRLSNLFTNVKIDS